MSLWTRYVRRPRRGWIADAVNVEEEDALRLRAEESEESEESEPRPFEVEVRWVRNADAVSRGEGLYFVRKSTRTSLRPYAGPTLRDLGEEPRYYSNRAEAEDLAERLTELNPVGFVVVDLVEEVDRLDKENLRLFRRLTDAGILP